MNNAEAERPTSIARAKAPAAVLVAFLALVTASNVAVIDADPPHWIEEAYIVDGGWWASSARAKVLFGDFSVGDFGMASLLAPGYTWVLVNVYESLGVGLGQTIAASAVSNTLITFIIAWLMWRTVGPTGALLATIMLGLNPFFWAQGRVGLPEPMQALFVVLAFSLLFGTRSTIVGAVAAGLALAFAVAVKPTAILMGVVPVLLACLVVCATNGARRGGAGLAHVPTLRWKTFVVFLSSLTIGMLMLFVLHFLVNIEVLRQIFSTDRGMYGTNLKNAVGTIGKILVSKEIGADGDFYPVLWRGAKWAPAMVLGVWLYLLWLIVELRGGVRQVLTALSPLEVGTLTWVASTCLAIWAYPGQPDYRYVAAVPGFAILGSLAVLRLAETRTAVVPAPVRRGKIYVFVLWAVLLAPAMLVLKPAMGRWFMAIARNLPLGEDPGIDYAAAGTLFMAGWVCLLALLAWFSGLGRRLSDGLATRRIAWVLAPCLVFQCWVLGDYFARADSTLVDYQRRAGAQLGDSAIVTGRLSASVFFPNRIHAVRRIRMTGDPLEVYESPAALSVLHAKEHETYAVIPRSFNFRPYGPHRRISQDLEEAGYAVVDRFHVGPVRAGTARFEFELYGKRQLKTTRLEER